MSPQTQSDPEDEETFASTSPQQDSSGEFLCTCICACGSVCVYVCIPVNHFVKSYKLCYYHSVWVTRYVWCTVQYFYYHKSITTL